MVSCGWRCGSISTVARAHPPRAVELLRGDAGENMSSVVKKRRKKMRKKKHKKQLKKNRHKKK